MALRSDEIIDATQKGNVTRFINHSCEPNCETQKWTVNGDLRIGFFTLRNLQAGEEITFDYQFQRYGRKAQKCYCGTPSCRGYIGGSDKTFSLNGHGSPGRDSDEERAHKKTDKNGFKIPKLSRSQRKEIEERLKEELTTNNEVVKEEKTEVVNNPFVRNQITKPPATNGLVNNAAPTKRRIDPTTNNINLTPAPKISKEEHRQQFEMSVRLKEYYENIERHYGSAVAEQVKMSHAFSTLNGLSLPFPHHLLASQNLFYLSAAAAASHPMAPIVSPSLVVGIQQPNSQSPTQPSAQPAASQTPLQQQQQQTVLPPQSPFQLPNLAASTQSILPQSAIQITAVAATATTNTASTIPSRLSTLIVLANDFIEPADKIDDKLAFSICDYDEYYNIRERPLEAQDIINNEAYPYPGSYYTTPDGEKWFVTVTLDRKTQKPKTVILNLNKIGPGTRESSIQNAIKEEKPRYMNDPRNGIGLVNGSSNHHRIRQSLYPCDNPATHKFESKMIRDRRLSRHARVESAFPYKSRVSALHEIQQ